MEKSDLEKLARIKRLINPFIKMLNRYIPTIQETKAINKLTRTIFKEVKKNLAGHPKEFYEDGNFPLFLETIEKAIIYISEKDPHYRFWLGYFYLAVVDIIGYEYDRFNYKKYYEQHRDLFKTLHIKDPRAKPVLFLHFLGQHCFSFKLGKTQQETYIT